MCNYLKSRVANPKTGSVELIKVFFFAGFRELAGINCIEVQGDGISDIRELVDRLAQLLPSELIEALKDETSMVSVDHKYAGWDGALHQNAEVGFLPPVSGG